jgi:chemotaxis protein CheY-P-specific phosphatase CheC
MDLNELQRDALGEIFNIGVGRAASSLSQIVNDTVLLSASFASFRRLASTLAARSMLKPCWCSPNPMRWKSSA